MDGPFEHLAAELREICISIGLQCKDGTPALAIEALGRQIVLMRDADSRIRDEGAVVVDGKGNPLEHPAIKIQRDAGREVREWFRKYGKR